MRELYPIFSLHLLSPQDYSPPNTGWEGLSAVILPLDSNMEFCGPQSLSMTRSPTTAASAGTEGPPGKTRLPWEWVNKGLSLCPCPGLLPTYSTVCPTVCSTAQVEGTTVMTNTFRDTDCPFRWHKEIRKSEKFFSLRWIS